MRFKVTSFNLTLIFLVSNQKVLGWLYQLCIICEYLYSYLIVSFEAGERVYKTTFMLREICINSAHVFMSFKKKHNIQTYCMYNMQNYAIALFDFKSELQ